MDLVLAAALFVTLTIAFFGIGAAAVAPASALSARLRTVLDSPAKSAGNSQTRVGRLEHVLAPASRALPKSPEELSRTSRLLTQAGLRETAHLTIYLGLRVMLPLFVLGIAFMNGWLFRAPLLTLPLMGIGYILPRFLLKRRIRLRQHRIRLGLPDALDLAVICVEAGLALDQAIQRVSRDLQHAHKELSEELELVHLEMRAGKPRAAALRNLAERTTVDDVRNVVAVLLQTDRFGTSVATALRVHADSLRTERRQRAEEAAAKTTIKMVPVLVLFVFPPMFFVTVGPAAIQLVRDVAPALIK